MTDRIEKHHTAGTPIGTYDIHYFRVVPDKPVIRRGCYDPDVPKERLSRIEVRENEIAVAVCKSQPGGLVVFGSAAAMDAWNAWEN